MFIAAVLCLCAAGDAAPNMTVDLMLPPNATAVVSPTLQGAIGDLQYIDLQGLAYSTTPIRPSRRAFSSVSIVWGAGNSHGKKTLEQALQLVDSAVTQWGDTDIVLFPECFLYNGSNAETVDHGAVVTAMQTKAAEHKIYLIVPIYELLKQGQSQDGPTFNTAVLLGRNGSVVGKYHKHFPTTKEMNANVLPGFSVPVFDLDFGRIAMLICWDFNFPEVWHAVAAQDVDVVFWPSAAKGAENVIGHAMNHNYFIAANGLGQFYNQIGSRVPSEAVNVTLKADKVLYTTPSAGQDTGKGLGRLLIDTDQSSPPSEIVLLTKASLDLDSVVIFYGGPSAKQNKIRDFLAANTGKITIEWTSEVSKCHLLRATTLSGVSVRKLLREAGIETRQEEETRNRQVANQARKAAWSMQ
jgi:predicted amidohydrolase